MPDRPTEVTVKVNSLNELFCAHEFDPFADDVHHVRSIAAMAQLPHLVSQLKSIKLRVLVPASVVTPDIEERVCRALQRYCAHAIADARRRLAGMRWVGARAFLIGLLFFAISLAASTALGRANFIPEEFRTLASESLIVAGWVVMWQPLDTLMQGWWPQWQEERTFKAIAEIPLRVMRFDANGV